MKRRIRHINTVNKLMVAKGNEGGGMDQMSEEQWDIQASGYGMNK